MRDTDYWYPQSPARFKRLTMHLTAMEELIVRRIQDYYMESSKGPIPDSDQALANISGFPIDQFLAHAAGVRSIMKKANKNKDGETGAFLSIPHLEGLLADQRERSRTKSANGSKGGRGKKKENNPLKPTAKQNASTGHIQDNKEDTVVSSSRPPAFPRSDLAKAFSIYNETAERAGIPKAQRLNPAREARLAARLREAGGLDGWKAAMDKLEASDFCTGRKNGWKANIDFVLQESSFTKLMEGNYDNGPRNNGNPGSGAAGSNQLEGFSRAAENLARKGHGNRPDNAGADADYNLFSQGSRRRDNTPD